MRRKSGSGGTPSSSTRWCVSLFRSLVETFPVSDLSTHTPPALQLYHATCHAEAALSRSNAVAASSASAAASRASLRTSRESTPNLSAAGSRKRKADSVDPAAVANTVTQSTTATSSSPLKPKVEGESTQGGGGTDEPDPKRVKAEPQEEEEQVNVVGTLDTTASEVGALEQQPARVANEIGREPTPPPPVFSTSSSLFLPE